MGEYAYVPSPYDADRKAKYEELLKGKEKQPTDKAFRPPNPSKKGGYGFAGTTLGGKGPGVLGEYAYKEHGHRDKEPPPPSFPVPFRPSAPGKKGYNCTMTPFAKHVADPQEIRQMQVPHPSLSVSLSCVCSSAAQGAGGLARHRASTETESPTGILRAPEAVCLSCCVCEGGTGVEASG